MAPSNIIVIDDTIRPSDGDYDHLTQREIRTREAMLVITTFGPLFAAVFTLFATKRWWNPNRVYSFGVLAAVWFVTVSVFGTVVYFQRGVTTRLTFMLAIIHGQVEILIWLLLLNVPMTKALLVSWIWGMTLDLLNLVLPSPDIVFMVASIVAGANDFMIIVLLGYAKLWTLALGAVGHLASAVVVFTGFVYFVPIVTYNALILVAVWFHIGATIGGYLALRNAEGDTPLNPMYNVKVPRKTVYIMLGVSFIGTTIITMILSYVVPG